MYTCYSRKFTGYKIFIKNIVSIYRHIHFLKLVSKHELYINISCYIYMDLLIDINQHNKLFVIIFDNLASLCYYINI